MLMEETASMEGKVKIKLSNYLTKYYDMKMLPLLHYAPRNEDV
jgi:hypothetical protein